MTEEEIDWKEYERERKKQKGCIVLIVFFALLFLIGGYFSFRLVFDNGGKIYRYENPNEERKSEIIEAYGLSDSIDYDIEAVSIMWSIRDSFIVLELNESDFEAFKTANPEICSASYEYKTESFIFKTVNYRPVRDDDEKITVRYSEDKIYISAFSYDVNDISEIVFGYFGN